MAMGPGGDKGGLVGSRTPGGFAPAFPGLGGVPSADA